MLGHQATGVIDGYVPDDNGVHYMPVALGPTMQSSLSDVGK